VLEEMFKIFVLSS